MMRALNSTAAVSLTDAKLPKFADPDVGLRTALLDCLPGAVAQAQQTLPARYRGILNCDCFRGGWCEDPKFSSTKYNEYSRWIDAGADPLPSSTRKLTDYALIGANKCWALLEELIQGVQSRLENELRSRLRPDGTTAARDEIYPELKPVATQTIQLGNGVQFVSSQHRWHPFLESYADKQLYIVDGRMKYSIRAVSTRDFSCSQGDRVVTDRAELKRILGYFRDLDRGIRNGTAKYFVTACYDVS